MFHKVKKSIQFGAHELTLETGEIARQADGAVMVSYGDTVILVAVTAKTEVKAGQDFFPLTVDYMEKTYAAGKIPGSFFKREGRPSEKETLTSRLIDRPLRPYSQKLFITKCKLLRPLCHQILRSMLIFLQLLVPQQPWRFLAYHSTAR